MPMPVPDHSTTSARKSRRTTEFATTRWSVVLSAKNEHSDESRKALESLCETYWMPLYGYVRRRGNAQHEAEDLTQGFFAAMLERPFLSTVDRRKGKFRSFLLTCLKNYMNDRHKHDQREKRGGGVRPISLDHELKGFEIGASEPDPELAYDRSWAITLLRSALRALEAEAITDGKQERFEVLKPFLTGEVTDEQAEACCASLQLSRPSLQVAVHRLRQRYREAIRSAVAGRAGLL